MASPRDFVYDEQGEMLPSDSSAAAERRKVLDDESRVVADAESNSRAPAKAKPKAPIVTKEQLEKSGYTNLRDYMNAQKGLKRRDGKAPERRADAAAPQKPKTASEYSRSTDEMRSASRMASMKPKSSTSDALRAKSRKEAAFEGAKRMAKTPEAKAKMAERAKSQALERVTPEEYLLPGASLKALHKQAAKLAKPKIMEYSPKMLPAPKAAPKADVKALEAPRQRLNYDKAGAKAKERAARAEKRRSDMLEENAERYGLNTKSPSYEAAAKSVREGLGGKDFSFKKGGRVSASKMGSSHTSGAASKRADGIAQRGKTRCRVY